MNCSMKWKGDIMRNSLSKDIEKEIANIQYIIVKHSIDLHTEYKHPLETVLEALNEARINAIVDEVVDGRK